MSTVTASAADVASVRAAFASLAGSGGTVVITGGTSNIDDTLVCGVAEGGSGAPPSFINIVCPDGADSTGFHWTGPLDGRPAFLFAKNTHFKGGGFHVRNMQADRGESVGIAFGGSGGPNNIGNACNGIDLSQIMVSGFLTGFAGGANWGCGSEVSLRICFIGNCDYGLRLDDFNALNFNLYNTGAGGCRIGLSTTSAENLNVFGGSFSGNTEADLECGQNAGLLCVGLRSEGSAAFLKGDGGHATLIKCLVKDSAGIIGNFSGLSIQGCTIPGSIPIDTNTLQAFEMTDGSVTIDPTTNLPGVVAGAWDSITKVYIRGNRGGWGSPACDDFWGRITASIIEEPPGPLFRHNIRIIDEPHRLDPFIVSRPYGGSRLDLAGIRSLSQGIGGGKNFTLGAQFKGSNKCQVLFTRQMTVSGIGRATHTITAAGTADNRFFTCDAGRPITLLGQGTAAGRKDWSGKIERYNSPTSADISSAVDQTLSFPAGVTAIVGEDEPDANYDVWLSPNKGENIWVASRTATGFTLSSSNRSSTATVSCLVVGR